MNIVHITTVHQRFDSRIFYKECLSLSLHHKVTLIVADGRGDQTSNSVRIIDIGSYSSRLKRLLFAPLKAIRIAKQLNADIYHFHDPELLIAVRRLAYSHKVIFDSHEDFPKLMLQRPYIPTPLRRLFFSLAKHIEKKTTRSLFAVVTATDNINQKFLSYHTLPSSHIVTVKNYPILPPSSPATPPSHVPHTPFTACYVGGLTKIRGVKEMILACEKANTKLLLAGPFDDPLYLQEMQSLSGWKNVEYLGVVPHKDLFEKVYSRSDVGLNLLLAAPNHIDAIPIKQLEYMSAALPVLSTQYIRFCVEITNQTHCGILVRPEDTDQCSQALLELQASPTLLQTLSSNAYQAFRTTYNWDKEKDALLALYSL